MCTARGYDCLTFDGPGQGNALWKQGLHFRPDWERVITPVVDFALNRPGVDPKRIAIQGISQGGYWVPRAVAFEKRIAAAIADPGVVDVSASPLSGFRLLPEAPTAFNARVALLRAAQKSLDVQYYLIADDAVGRMFLRELRDAAQRGVRVRLLVDDLYTGGQDPLLAGLAACPSVEVRVFNPFPLRSARSTWRILSSLDDFSRVNHRMHNKLFISWVRAEKIEKQ